MSGSGLVLRPMTTADISQVFALDVMSFSLPWPERSYHYEVEDNIHSRPWVMEDVSQAPTRIIGMIVVWMILDEAHVATLAVHPEYRRRGIGQHLLANALLEAQKSGAVLAFLEVRKNNLAAQALYRRFGFVEDGIRPHYYADNGEDAILLSLRPLDPQALTILLNASEKIS
ncbi:MAG TPA: ribosomal protein S18-alanine N-acetyltransferase [Longilinea sp.]|nr:ribosomal protein S18-alanine N-acetyltransferase [Longilinea sp.]